MTANEDPAVIAAEVSKLLNALNHRSLLVRRLAKDIGSAIGYELAFKDEDMAEVVRKQSAMREPIITFLERHGAEGRSSRVRTKVSSGL